MTRNFLDDAKGYTCITHLSQGGTTKTVGANSFEIDALASLAQYPVGRIGLDMTLTVSARKKIAPSSEWLILFEPDFQILNNGNGAGSEFSFGAAFSDNQFGSNSSFGIKDILDVEGDALVNTTGGVETDGKKSSISDGIESKTFIKE